MTERDPLTVLHRRIDVLDVLASGPAHKPAVVESLDVSRSTVDRALRALESLDYVRRVDAGYRATPTGRLAARAFHRLERQLEAVEEARPLLDGLETEALPSPAVLVDADVEPARPPAPHRPLEHVKDLARSAERYRGLSPMVTDEEFLDIFYRAVHEREADVEFVFTESMVEFITSEYPDAVSELIGTGDFRIFARETLPYGLALAEAPAGAETCLVVYGEGSNLSGVLANDTPVAVAWARETYRAFREDAREVEPP